MLHVNAHLLRKCSLKYQNQYKHFCSYIYMHILSYNMTQLVFNFKLNLLIMFRVAHCHARGPTQATVSHSWQVKTALLKTIQFKMMRYECWFSLLLIPEVHYKTELKVFYFTVYYQNVSNIKHHVWKQSIVLHAFANIFEILSSQSMKS